MLLSEGFLLSMLIIFGFLEMLVADGDLPISGVWFLILLRDFFFSKADEETLLIGWIEESFWILVIEECVWEDVFGLVDRWGDFARV